MEQGICRLRVKHWGRLEDELMKKMTKRLYHDKLITLKKFQTSKTAASSSRHVILDNKLTTKQQDKKVLDTSDDLVLLKLNSESDLVCRLQLRNAQLVRVKEDTDEIIKQELLLRDLSAILKRK